MNKNIINVVFLLFSFMLCSCEDISDNYKENVVPQYTLDYDDGQTIYINVKLAVDKKGWEEKGEEFFKTKLTEQWRQINERFNVCGQKGNVKLARKYVFQPDIDNIIVYDGCSYWGSADKYVISHMIETTFKLVVVYDCYYEGSEAGEYGGGCGNNNGVGTILVINASDAAKNKYNDHFDEYTYRAITHELGHFRGVIDLYAEVIDGANNPVNGESFMPISCLMNNQTYTPDAESVWSDYAVKIINKAGNKKVPGMIDEYMYEDFAKELVIKATEKGSPVNAEIKLYPQTARYANAISATPSKEIILENGVVNLDAYSVFFHNPNNDKTNRTAIFLVEANSDGRKKYVWLADYMLHNAGIDGEKTYTVNFEF